MTAYLWHIDGNLRHHLRAETVAEARERIAATHGEETARRAVIRAFETSRTNKCESAAA
jgi:RPA family protein